MRKAWLNAALAMAGLGLLTLCGCGSGGAAAITIQIEPATSVSLDEGQSFNFTATVANDLGNKGVTWSLVQTSSSACSGAGCGSLQNATNSSVTYVAPTNLTAGESVTLTAKSIANQAVTATATISVVVAPSFSTTTLPNGANGVPYNQTIGATGGVAPLKFSIASGNLPAGLSLSQSGVIVGRPSAPALAQPPAQSTFTVLLSDSATPPATATQSFSITVTPPTLLSISTTSLPSGFANARYNGSVSATGGVTPLTWSVLPGSGAVPFNNLPPGLGLNSVSGQITGIVGKGTQTGTYSFTVQARDNSLPSPQSAQALLSITITLPPPLAISTTSLPSGATATAYNASLLATGGIQPYTWTVTSGLLPSGLSLAPDGSLLGIPVLATTSPDQFTVQVQDSEASPTAASQSLSITIAAGGTGDSLFHGQYSFLFRGFDSGGLVAIAGTLSADGNGNITSGIEDSNRILPNNGPVQVVSNIALTGTYSIGTDGRGTLQLIATNPGTGVTLTTDYRLVLDSGGNIRFIQNNDIATPGVNTDTLGTHGAGIFKPVVGSGFSAASLNGNYAFEFTGQDLSGKSAALIGAVHADGVGLLTSDAGELSSDFNDAGSFDSQPQSVPGRFSFSGSKGAAQLTLATGSSQTTLNFSFYFVSISDVFFVETDSSISNAQATFFRLSGEMILQQPAYQFTNASLMGASVVTGTGLNGSNASVLAGLLTSPPPGNGTATLAYDENNGGALASLSFPGTYSVASNGRVTFAGFASSGSQPRVAVAYLTGPGQGFLLGSDAAATAGILEQQTSATLSTSSVQGGYTLGTAVPGDVQVTNVIGQVSTVPAVPLPPSPSIIGTIDEVDPPTTSASEGTPHLGQTLSATLNFVGANGRGTITTNSPIGVPTTLVFYIVSPGNFRAVSADSNPGNGHPEVFFFDH